MWFVILIIVWEFSPSIKNWIDAKTEEIRSRTKKIKEEQ